jgi:hypothetical protein
MRRSGNAREEGLDLGVNAHGEIGVAEHNQIFEAEPENRNNRREG